MRNQVVAIALLLSPGCDKTKPTSSTDHESPDNEGFERSQFEVFSHPKYPSFSDVDKVEIDAVIADAITTILPKIADAKRIELMRIDPLAEIKEGGRDELHRIRGYRVAGTHSLAATGIERVKAALSAKLIPRSYGAGFAPRHAINLHTETNFISLLLCFECSQMVVVKGGKAEGFSNYFFLPSLRPALDEILEDHGIARARHCRVEIEGGEGIDPTNGNITRRDVNRERVLGDYWAQISGGTFTDESGKGAEIVEIQLDVESENGGPLTVFRKSFYAKWLEDNILEKSVKSIALPSKDSTQIVFDLETRRILVTLPD